MTVADLKEAIYKLRGYIVVEADLTQQTFITDKRCVYSFETTKTGLLKANSILFLWTISNFENCSY